MHAPVSGGSGPIVTTASAPYCFPGGFGNSYLFSCSGTTLTVQEYNSAGYASSCPGSPIGAPIVGTNLDTSSLGVDLPGFSGVNANSLSCISGALQVSMDSGDYTCNAPQSIGGLGADVCLFGSDNNDYLFSCAPIKRIVIH